MWLINTYIPMAGAIKSLLNIVVFVVVLIWLLQTFGLIGNIPGLGYRRSGERCPRPAMKSEIKMKQFKASSGKSARLVHGRNIAVSPPAATRLPPQGNW